MIRWDALVPGIAMLLFGLACVLFRRRIAAAGQRAADGQDKGGLGVRTQPWAIQNQTGSVVGGSVFIVLGIAVILTAVPL